MATEINVDDINEGLQDLLSTVRQTESGWKNSLSKYMNRVDTTAKAYDKLNKATGGLADSFMSATKKLAQGSEDITVLSDVIGDMAKAIPVVGSAISGTVKLLGEQAQLGMNAFYEIASSGQVTAGGLTKLANDLDAIDLPIDRWASLLSKSSQDLAYFNGGALKGGQQFTETMTAMRSGVDDTLRRLGYRVDDIGELTVAYEKMQKQRGIVSDMDALKRSQAAEKYIKQLDILSKLTGESAKALQQQREELLADSRFRAWDRRMRREGQSEAADRMTEAMNLIGKQMGGAQMQEIIKGMIGGAFTGERARAMAAFGGEEIMQLTEQLKAGNLTSVEYYNQLIQVAKKYPQAAERLQEFGIDLGVNFADIADFAERQQIAAETYQGAVDEQTKRAAEKEKDATGKSKDATDNFVEAVRGMNAATGDLQSILIGNGSLAQGVNLMADGMQKMTGMLVEGTDMLNNWLGGETMLSTVFEGATNLFDAAVESFNDAVDAILDFFGSENTRAKREARERQAAYKGVGSAEQGRQAYQIAEKKLTEALANTTDPAERKKLEIQIAALVKGQETALQAEAQARKKYEAVLARQGVSVAAPTATPNVPAPTVTPEKLVGPDRLAQSEDMKQKAINFASAANARGGVPEPATPEQKAIIETSSKQVELAEQQLKTMKEMVETQKRVERKIDETNRTARAK